ncbi:monodechloroaminopyrrolnitrin synthase PrnB family protein [Streptomyces sp. URMC 123]|uniref:monodechloroaminopyrrolnitrin synthase PrnB family protein n=1 Tax=Streptomyces sp. URMC 123 TaxID=3423403 RepID=UPI003F1D3DD2
MTVTSTAFSAARENREDQEVADRDPLGADPTMAALAEANERQDVAWLLARAHRLAGACRVTTALDARAALRDLGFLIASAIRHDPAADVTALDSTLRRLGELAGEVPRDTVYSYATRNPSGARRRAFTRTPEEELFISSVTEATIHLNHAVERLAGTLFPRVSGTAAEEDERPLVDALRASRESIDVLQARLVDVKRKVSPQLFSRHLRPYFPVITVDGRDYAAPGGAQMPLLALDVMLFAHRARDPDMSAWHADYMTENITYLPPAHRAVCEEFLALDGTTVRRRTAVALGSPPVRAAYRALLLRVLRFRYPHRQLARDNMRVRPDGSLGSGGYSDAVLDRIIELNTASLRSLAEEEK